MKIRPHEQGALTSLCGIYSIVNAMRIVKGLSNEESKDLFEQIINYLEENKNLAVSLTSGISIKVMGSIFKDVIGDRIDRSIPFHKQPETRVGEFWVEMKKFLDEGRVHGVKRAILLSLNGEHDHWTIGHKVTRKRIYLFDSIGLKYLDRRNCTTHKTSSGRRHLIQPTQSYFLA